MEQSGGEIAAKRVKPSDGAAAAGGDLLSALPDDVLVLILLRLGTAAAVQTSSLSRRWRRVWALLPELRFHLAPDGPRIRELLDAPEAPELRCVSVTTEDAAPHSAAAWLPVAARRLSGDLVYHNVVPGNHVDEDDDDDDGDEEGAEEAGVRGDVQLPCFGKAIKIVLNLGFLSLALPSMGIFPRLTKLSLSRVRFRGPCELGNLVSSPRCPCLQKLKVHDSRGLHNLSIHSESLLQIKLESLYSLQQLTIVAPALLGLAVTFSFIDDDPSKPIANISAPQLVSLTWRDLYDPRYVHLGNLGRLQKLNSFFIVFGQHASRDKNQYCLRLLQQFQVIHSLKLMLVYRKDIDDFQYLMGDMKMLPQITFLQLAVSNEGHAFGASSFHLLRMCTGLRRLVFVLHDNRNLEAQSTCPSGCICDQPTSWKTEGLVLNHLEHVTIFGLQGAEREVTFVKQLFSWGMVLKNIRITFDYQVTESKARDFCQALAGFSRPETFVEFHLFRDADKRSVYLLAPEGQGTDL
ncbi:hypothetical protein SEVIR_2G014600v4 [Setaria viridis]|uniref:Uncharacterized protein n=1 Tax=Setaria viridis TaxID=4556 RepID=A0A4U6VKI0_SETVI|nr:putative F-box/FBD/LRR-repeat protein At4g03220 [Setaria viridis]TKW30128.1 hypothetical protein SEVIR_2G014600v2 [Setaria viridis]